MLEASSLAFLSSCTSNPAVSLYWEGKAERPGSSVNNLAAFNQGEFLSRLVWFEFELDSFFCTLRIHTFSVRELLSRLKKII